MKEFIKAFKVLITGFFIGIAMILPGLSWPMMAMITGIYEPLMITLGKLISKPLSMSKEEWKLLFFLATGTLPSIFILSVFIPKLFASFTFEINSLFIGLVAGSIYILYHDVKRKGYNELIWFTAGMAAIIIPLAFGVKINDVMFFSTARGTLVLDFISGFATSTALPAVGDTLMLIILGNYEHLLLAVKTFEWLSLSIFVSGFAIGFFMFTRLINWMLRTYRSQIFAFIIGLMISSLSYLWPFDGGHSSLKFIMIFLVLAISGIFISIYFTRGSLRGGYNGS